MNVQVITRHTFVQGAGLYCYNLTGHIANSDYDSDTMQPKFVACMGRECLNTSGYDALPLP